MHHSPGTRARLLSQVFAGSCVVALLAVAMAGNAIHAALTPQLERNARIGAAQAAEGIYRTFILPTIVGFGSVSLGNPVQRTRLESVTRAYTETFPGASLALVSADQPTVTLFKTGPEADALARDMADTDLTDASGTTPRVKTEARPWWYAVLYPGRATTTAWHPLPAFGKKDVAGTSGNLVVALRVPTSGTMCRTQLALFGVVLTVTFAGGALLCLRGETPRRAVTPPVPPRHTGRT